MLAHVVAALLLSSLPAAVLPHPPDAGPIARVAPAMADAGESAQPVPTPSVEEVRRAGSERAARIALLVLLASAVFVAAQFFRQARARGRRLAESERMYRALASGISDMVTLHGPQGTIQYVSPSAFRLIGYGADDLIGRSLIDFLHPDDQELARRARSRVLRDGYSNRLTLRIRCRNGKYRWFECLSQGFPDSDRGETVVVSRDVTEQIRVHAVLRRTQARYRELAYHDARTGLLNRQGLLVRLGEALQQVERGEAPGVALICIDIDNFKTVNDSRGTAAGDEMLVAFSQRLKTAASESCELARAGGDQFVVLVRTGDHEYLHAFTSRIVAAFAQPLSTSGETAYLTISAGMAEYPEHGAKADKLLAASEIALEAAKKAGKNTWRCFTEELGKSAAQRASSLRDLRNAFERGEFTLHYQPKVLLATGLVTGYEALLRWNAAQGVRATGELIEAAEQSGFITTLGEWVLRTAAAQSVAWRSQGFEHSVAVNVSALQLQDRRFSEFLAGLVQRDPELPRYLIIELTESTLALEADRALHALNRLSAMGFAMHIDDFGTGYSSLSRLSRMPVNTLKIDKSFVAGTPGDVKACEIVKGIVALARALRLNVIAEGVETPAQARFLMESGCSEGQGFWFGRPVAALDIDDRLPGLKSIPAAARSRGA